VFEFIKDRTIFASKYFGLNDNIFTASHHRSLWQ